jgi:hypothetical protein
MREDSLGDDAGRQRAGIYLYYLAGLSFGGEIFCCREMPAGSGPRIGNRERDVRSMFGCLPIRARCEEDCPQYDSDDCCGSY